MLISRESPGESINELEACRDKREAIGSAKSRNRQSNRRSEDLAPVIGLRGATTQNRDAEMRPHLQ
jgi:hypothetical protein